MTEREDTEAIVAIVTTNRDQVLPGGAPIFVAASAAEQKKVAVLLSHILAAAVHDLENGTYVLVRH